MAAKTQTMKLLTLPLLVFVLLLSSCAVPAGELLPGSTPETFTISPAAPDSVEPTKTIIWFPATSTWTPFPTVEPSATPVLRPGIGEKIFQDGFKDLKNWSFASTESRGENSIILNRSRLTLAINQPPSALFSLNTNQAWTDFYAEITISANRCFGPDTYGLLFRAASGAYAYRFLLNCSGQARVEQAREGLILPLQKWVPSGDAPSGAPGLVKMGVWVAGVEMRFFLNDHYQFSVIDPYFKNGALGVYANGLSPDGLNISFSDLNVYSVAYVSPTPTPTPSKTPTPSRTPRTTP